jgi:hypothetical protein
MMTGRTNRCGTVPPRHGGLQENGAVRAITVALSIVMAVPALSGWGEEADRAGPSGSGGTYRILLIGINHYRNMGRLTTSIADVERIGRTLGERGEAGPGSDFKFLMMTDEMPDDLKPTRANILRRLPEFLGAARRGDTVLFFFCGHGLQAKDGRTFLAPIDCRPQRLEETGVPLATVREAMEGCRAAVKFCVIDACHASPAKGEADGDSAPLTDAGIRGELGKATGVYSLASCQARERSIEWQEKGNGLFTYWLCRGLEGAADDDCDAVIRADELSRFVHDQVVDTARALNHTQTPVPIIGLDVAAAPAIYALRPEKAQATLRRIAEMVYEQAKAGHIGRLGVPTFAGRGASPGGELGPFGITAAEKMEKELARLGRGSYAVVERGKVEEAMARAGDPRAYHQIAAQEKLDAILKGEFLRQGDRIRIGCKLLRLPEGDVLASVSGLISVDRDLWVLLGGQVPPQPGPPAPPLLGSGWHAAFYAPPPADAPARPDAPNPLTLPDCPVRVAIISGGHAKALIPGPGGRLVFGTTPEEEYEIDVENLTDRSLMMKLLVDGVSTLAQSDDRPGLSHVLLDEARGWILQSHAKNRIIGWYKKTTPPVDLRRFKVDDPERSVAARLGFIQDVGQITIAVYEEANSSPPPPAPILADRSGPAFREADDEQKSRARRELAQKADEARGAIGAMGLNEAQKVSLKHLNAEEVLDLQARLNGIGEVNRAMAMAELRERLSATRSFSVGTAEGRKVEGASLPPVVSFRSGRMLFAANIHYYHENDPDRQ